MQARELAYKVLSEVENGAYANISLDGFLRKHKLSSADKALATELVYGTVKYKAKLDWIIGQVVNKEKKLEIGPRTLLRLAFYQLLFMDRIPPRAVTDETVKIAKKYYHRGVASLINGVLRNYLRDPEKVVWPNPKDNLLKYLEVYYSHPIWMLKRWVERYGLDNTIKICDFNNKPAELWIRTNTLRINRQDLLVLLKQQGCEAVASNKVPEAICLHSSPPVAELASFQEGLFTVQDETSMLPAHLLGPRPGQKILDVCAGPGGKSTHIAQLMENKGAIVACDVHQHRLALVEENARRLGVKIITTVLQDASQITDKQKYDLILVDAPCSGLGVIRRRADSRWRKKPQDIEELAKLQKKILHKAFDLLLPGGRLVYSTCTIEPEENKDVVEAFMAERNDVTPCDITLYWPYQENNEEIVREMKKGMRQLLPFRDNMEGFFLAGLKKK